MIYPLNSAACVTSVTSCTVISKIFFFFNNPEVKKKWTVLSDQVFLPKFPPHLPRCRHDYRPCNFCFGCFKWLHCEGLRGKKQFIILLWLKLDYVSTHLLLQVQHVWRMATPSVHFEDVEGRPAAFITAPHKQLHIWAGRDASGEQRGGLGPTARRVNERGPEGDKHPLSSWLLFKTGWSCFLGSESSRFFQNIFFIVLFFVIVHCLCWLFQEI